MWVFLWDLRKDPTGLDRNCDIGRSIHQRIVRHSPCSSRIRRSTVAARQLPRTFETEAQFGVPQECHGPQARLRPAVYSAVEPGGRTSIREGLALTVAYAGSKGTNLILQGFATVPNLNLNQIPDKYFSMGSAPCWPGVPNPFYGKIRLQVWSCRSPRSQPGCSSGPSRNTAGS